MALQRMTLNLLAGSATVRVHRTEPAFPIEHQTAVSALRMVESKVPFWSVEAHQELLKNVAEGEAFLAAQPGQAYLLYFPEGGKVGLKLGNYPNVEFSLEWVDLTEASYGTSSTISGGSTVNIQSPGNHSWIAIITH